MDIYFDNSATTAVSKEAADKAYEIMLSGFGNPSSLHHMGVVAEEELKTARKNVALLLARDEKGIIFTASGTEANNLAILGSVKTAKKKGNKIITAMIEHPSVLEPCRYLERNGFEVSYIKVDRDGIIDLEQFEEALDENTVLVSVMSANNEVGTIQPLKQIASFKDKYDFILHTDMVQGMAKIKGEEIPREVDLISVSGHKIHAPKGVGGLWIRDKLNLSPIVFGALPVHVLIETLGALHDVWEIAGLPGVESIDFGLMDFVSDHHGAIPGAAMKSPGQFEHPLIVRAKCEIATAALARGVA